MRYRREQISNNHRTDYVRFLNEKFAELKIGKYQKKMDNIFDVLLRLSAFMAWINDDYGSVAK